jgi:hypothetical protein
VIDTIPNMAATAAVRAGTAWGWLPLEGIAPIACGGPSATNPEEFIADAWLPGGYLRVITSTREHTIQLLRLAVQRFPDL